MREASQNPVADLISLPFQNNTNFNVGRLDNTQNVLNIQPVVPMHLNPSWNLISRSILPVVYQPRSFAATTRILAWAIWFSRSSCPQRTRCRSRLVSA